MHGNAGDGVGINMGVEDEPDERRHPRNIIVEGNAGDSIGSGMKRGIIIINGNAGSGIGVKMEGGQILLNGGCGSIAKTNLRYSSTSGIYHKGTLIRSSENEEY